MQRGQVLVIFAGGLVLILAIAALVFDVGQNLLDRRTEQNVSDAAALAGARYVHTAAYTYHGGCSAAPAGMPAVTAACSLAADSGYVDGQAGRTVRIDLPPVVPSTFSGLPGYIEVQIGNTRPSFFAGILGLRTQKTAALGVATNDSDIALPYSLLALDPAWLRHQQDQRQWRNRDDKRHRSHRFGLFERRDPSQWDRCSQLT